MKNTKYILALLCFAFFGQLLTSCSSNREVVKYNNIIGGGPGIATTQVKKDNIQPAAEQNLAPKAVEQTAVASTEANEPAAVLNTTADNSVTTAASKSEEFNKLVNENGKKIELTSRQEKKLLALKEKLEKKAAKKSSAAKSGGKSQLIALLLVIFVGGLGIHRFYLGYIWQGVVQLLTGGGCGIWALIDLIRIITGDLKPKDGDYDTKL